MENNMKFPRKIKNRITICPSSSTSGDLSEENKQTKKVTQKDTCSPENNQVSIDRWMNKEDVLPIQ